MKKMIFALIAALTVSMSAFAGWNPVETSNSDWESTTFVASPTGAVGHTFDIAISDAIANNGGAENIEVWVNIEGINTTAPVNGETPFYIVFVSVDEQVGTSWKSMGDSTQQNISQYTAFPTEREIILESGMVFDEGRPFPTENGFRFKFGKNPSETLRIRIAAQDARQGGPAALEDVTVSARYRFY